MDEEPITTDADTSDSNLDSVMESEMSRIYDARHDAEPDTPPDDGPGTVRETMGKVWDDKDTEQSPVPEPETTESPTGVRMPQAWSKEQAAVWNGLTPDAQAYIAERELQAQRRISELGTLAKGGEVHQVFEHYRNQGLVPLDDSSGELISATRLIESALELDYALRQSPAQVIHALANAHGVDLGQAQAPQGVDANLIRQQVYAEISQQQAWQQQQEQAVRARWLLNELDSFTKDKPYWDKIEDEVMAQVHALKMINPAAVNNDPIGLLRQAEKRALRQTGIDPDEGATKAAAKRKADEAKRISSMNVGRKSLGRAVSSSQNWEETLANTYDKIHGMRN
jgi:hypothetical protein